MRLCSVCFVVLALVLLAVLGTWLWLRRDRRLTYAHAQGPWTLGVKEKHPQVALLPSVAVRQVMRHNYSMHLFLYADARTAVAGAINQPLVAIEGLGHMEYDAAHEALAFSFKMANGKTYETRLSGVAAQQWHGIGLAVLGRTVDIYHNGSLVRSVELASLPAMQPQGVWLYPKANDGGRMFHVQAWSGRRTTQQMAHTYSAQVDARGWPRNLPDDSVVGKLALEVCGGEECRQVIHVDALKYVEYGYA
jgi:hypothetical protein